MECARDRGFNRHESILRDRSGIVCGSAWAVKRRQAPESGIRRGVFDHRGGADRCAGLERGVERLHSRHGQRQSGDAPLLPDVRFTDPVRTLGQRGDDRPQGGDARRSGLAEAGRPHLNGERPAVGGDIGGRAEGRQEPSIALGRVARAGRESTRSGALAQGAPSDDTRVAGLHMVSGEPAPISPRNSENSRARS